MKGDVVNLTRVIAVRLALAAFILSLVALSIYWAGNLQELSDPALFVSMDWAAGASIAGIVLAVLAAASALLAPLFSSRISFWTLLGSVFIIAANMAVLVLASTLRVVTGGIPL
ncbi:MAG: hypothetical protein AB7T74_04050 [Clostridia bacterium]|jgi:hypothetical protein|nr:hypothetical protein [Spirochaetia bacterium]